jgi:hypothetical protein
MDDISDALVEPLQRLPRMADLSPLLLGRISG